MTVRLRYHLNVLIVLAMALAGISPACKFINGNGSGAAGSILVEICTSEGVRHVAMSVASDAGDLGDADGGAQDIAQAMEPCTFCFTQTNLKSMATAALSVPAGSGVVTLAVLAGASVPSSDQASQFQARGPPVLL